MARPGMMQDGRTKIFAIPDDFSILWASQQSASVRSLLSKNRHSPGNPQKHLAVFEQASVKMERLSSLIRLIRHCPKTVSGGTGDFPVRLNQSANTRPAKLHGSRKLPAHREALSSAQPHFSPSLHASVLVLNRLYMAVHVIGVRRAFALLCRELAEVIHAGEEGIFGNYTFESWLEASQRRRGFPHDVLGHAAHQQSRQTAGAVCAHYDHIGI